MPQTRRHRPLADPRRPAGRHRWESSTAGWPSSRAQRGSGRAHALRMAEEGADIIGVDICRQLETVVYPMATSADLAATAEQVQALGRRIATYEVDVREVGALQEAFDAGAADLGPVGIVVANAGIGPAGASAPDKEWEEVIGVNLTGVWNTGRVAIPSMIEHGEGGSIILNSSTGGLTGAPSNVAGMVGYTAAKHGVIGLMRTWANYLAPHHIRVNSLAPTTVRTPMANDGDTSLIGRYAPELVNSLTNAIPVDAIDAIDVAHAAAWLASDEARYITGTVIPVDACNVNRR
ncbi:MAG: mycofactocin-coupled SDR family oxidoreductase [Acidimicrobiales bacterium]